jgi:hypothetical protein
MPSPESAAPEGGITSTPTDVTSSFAAFQRAGTPQDRAIGTGSKALSMLATAQQESGVNPSLARLVYQSATSTLALVPGKGVLCLLEEAQSISAECMSAAEADSHGIGITTHVGNREGASIIFAGVLPDGVHDVFLTLADGDRVAVPLSADGGYSVAPTTNPTSISYTDAGGVQHTEATAPAPPPPTPPPAP